MLGRVLLCIESFRTLFVRFPYFLVVLDLLPPVSCLFYISILPSFIAAFFHPRRPRTQCRAHRNDSVKFIHLRPPSTRLARDVLVYNPLSPGFGQAGNHRILFPLLCACVLSPRPPYAHYNLSRVLSRSLGIAASDLRPSLNSHERGLTPTFATLPRRICRLCQHDQGLDELLVCSCHSSLDL